MPNPFPELPIPTKLLLAYITPFLNESVNAFCKKGVVPYPIVSLMSTYHNSYELNN
jgi:hypothetical protein